MALDKNLSNEPGDITRFLNKFQESASSSFELPSADASKSAYLSTPKTTQDEYSFERLERKIQELEEKFDASDLQNEFILSELSQTREAIEHQKDKDVFLEHLSSSIASLKASVENLTRAQQERSFSFGPSGVQRNFDSFPSSDTRANVYPYQPDNYRAAQEQRLRAERDEKERLISNLHRKASQLKAVNSALDREIKKVQQEKTEALKKSAEQAKEILSLRNQLNAAEERFKSFNFEGRVISIRQEYQKRVNRLETQLKEISDTCVKQVEEIETLRAENIKLQQTAAEKEQVLHALQAKEQELQTLQDKMSALQAEQAEQTKHNHEQQLKSEQVVRSLEEQRDELAVQFQNAQHELQAVRSEKELLEKNFRELVKKINSNDAVIGELKQKIEVLLRQNEQLSKRTIKLEQDNRDLIRDKQAIQDELTVAKEQARKAAVPPPPVKQNKKEETTQPLQKAAAAQSAPATPISATAAASAPSAKEPEKSKPAAAPAARATAPKAEKVPPMETPVALTKKAKKPVKTEDDLPEIKIAEPVAQFPQVLDRDDFLEKTDSFIGRIKWSIFREDR
ncbi:MAG: hypothetical protein MJ053_02935 [Elusimicrobiaceae bacterium]|nr:hypothetical protein [Elusimicrobiaceae bacterium]